MLMNRYLRRIVLALAGVIFVHGCSKGKAAKEVEVQEVQEFTNLCQRRRGGRKLLFNSRNMPTRRGRRRGRSPWTFGRAHDDLQKFRSALLSATIPSER